MLVMPSGSRMRRCTNASSGLAGHARHDLVEQAVAVVGVRHLHAGRLPERRIVEVVEGAQVQELVRRHARHRGRGRRCAPRGSPRRRRRPAPRCCSPAVWVRRWWTITCSLPSPTNSGTYSWTGRFSPSSPSSTRHMIAVAVIGLVSDPVPKIESTVNGGASSSGPERPQRLVQHDHAAPRDQHLERRRETLLHPTGAESAHPLDPLRRHPDLVRSAAPQRPIQRPILSASFSPRPPRSRR